MKKLSRTGHFLGKSRLPTKLFFATVSLLPLWYGVVRFTNSIEVCAHGGSIPDHFSAITEVVSTARGLMSLNMGGRALRDPRTLEKESFVCDSSSNITDFCEIEGDVRIDYRTGSIVLFARRPGTPRGRTALKPYPRKWDGPVMDDITEQTLYSVGGGQREEESAQAAFEEQMQCTAYRDGPAVLFSAGGYSGGIFHDFNEVLLPLFQTTHAYEGDVTLIVADLKGQWWFRGHPRDSFAGAFTRYPIRLMGSPRDADGNRQGVECFSKLIVGLKHNLCLYNEWGGREARNEVKAGVRFRDFAPRVMQAMGIPEPVGAFKGVLRRVEAPRLCLVQRQKTRRFTNFERLKEYARDEGFRVVGVVFEELKTREIVRTMRECDALIGVHGAGFTNTIFMRPRSAILQVLPFGEYGGGIVVGREYKNIAHALGASYSEWRVSIEDSSLLGQFNSTAVEIADPERLWQEDLIRAMTLYHSQDVTVPEADFRTLVRHMRTTLELQDGVSESDAKVPADADKQTKLAASFGVGR